MFYLSTCHGSQTDSILGDFSAILVAMLFQRQRFIGLGFFLLFASGGIAFGQARFAFTNFAGLAGAAGTNNGTGSAARFHSPYGVAVDPGGNVYVADYDNHTIRKISTSGVV